jgi:hypothetical protein
MMKGIGIAAALVLLLIVGGAAHAAQNGPQVTAQLATGVVKFGGVVSCVVQVEGARSAALKEVPEVDGLRLERVSGPSSNQVTTIAGGRRISRLTLSWVVTLRPEKKGEFVIPPMRLDVDGKAMFTRELTLSVVEDLVGEELGHLEFVEAPQRVYEGQPFTVRINFGWDTKLDKMVNFANLILPWWNELPGTLEVESDAGQLGAPPVEVQVNSRVRVRAAELGQRELRGTTFRLLQLSRSFVATRSGSLDFPQSWLEFGSIRTRVFSEERETYHVGVPAFSIEVRTLPEAGRPPEFSGGVGRFEVQADVNRRDVDLGESIKLTVDWTGAANLEFFDLPNPARLPAFADFRVYGTTNDRFYGNRRRVVYDLAPKTSDAFEIPPLPLVVFDPELEVYTTVATRAIPIRVRALEGEQGLSDEGQAEARALAARDIQARAEPRDESSGVGGAALLAGWVGLPLLWLVSRSLVRRRGDPDGPAARRRRAARRRLRAELRRATTAGDQARALADFLAARTDEEPEAWEGRDPVGWCRQQELEVAPEALEALVAVTDDLDRRRWAGDDQKIEDARVEGVAQSLLVGGL